MDIKHLQTMEAIMTHGSYLKAAEALGYVQSTITLHVQQIEEELGVQLFEKQGRRMVLTQDGRVFWERARALVEQMASLKQAMSELSEGWLGKIRVGTIDSFFKKSVSPILMQFIREHPKVKVSLEFGGMLSISQRVSCGELDIGICPCPPHEPHLHFDPLKVEPLLLLLPAEHPLAVLNPIAPQDLVDAHLLLSEPICAYRAEVEKGLANAAIPLRPTLEIGDVGTIIQFVQGGLGIAFLPASAIDPAPPGTVVRSVAGLPLHITIGLLRQSRHLGKSGEKLYEWLLKQLQGGSF